VRLEGIPGNPLNLLETPEGCYFQDRCFACEGQCRDNQPELIEINSSPQRLVACHLVKEEEVSA
jgi:peptide/nickel transport system ATP-binding protein